MTAAAPAPRLDHAAAGLRFSAADVGYGTLPIVSGVELTVRRGELLGLVGPNGAGKSTLLRAVTGDARLLAGALHVAGVPHGELDAVARARIVGVVPQSPPMLFAFTAREFVEMGRHAHLGRFAGYSPADAASVERAMERTDTARLASQSVDTLSGGDLQRLTLAQALAQDPSVLLLDEPTSHLDLNHRLQVLDLVRELADEGMAVLGVFHDLDLAARYSDRLAVVSRGRVPVCGAPEAVLGPELVRDVFGVRAVVGTDAVTGSVSVTPVMREEAAALDRAETVFVAAGSGGGGPVMRSLALAGFRVTAGGLSSGDVDQAVASALGVRHILLPAFGRMGPEERVAVERLARDADVRVVCDMPFGGANQANLEAVALSDGPAVLVGAFDDGRDFTGGEAGRLWEALAAREGTAVVPGPGAVIGEVERLLKR